jgi:flagellar protein FliS
MNASRPNDALGQYRKTDAHGAAAADDRLQLIVHMMQGALDRVATARGHMQRHEVAEKGQEIDIAGNLDTLYQYMLKRLVEANLNDELAGLDEVADLLGEIKSAWQQMAIEYRPVAVREATAPGATV